VSHSGGEGMNSSEFKTRTLAQALFEEAVELQRRRQYPRAIELYTASLALHPGARTYAYRGWAHSFLGHYEQAIEDCRRALELDPQYGNAYNDIGAYLIELGRSDEAIAWLEQAIRTPRREARCYPFMNLARIYLGKGELRRALQTVRECLSVDPSYTPARQAVEQIVLRLH
jgi:tetratricopeptide (TPR) repeat protein